MAPPWNRDVSSNVMNCAQLRSSLLPFRGPQGGPWHHPSLLPEISRGRGVLAGADADAAAALAAQQRADARARATRALGGRKLADAFAAVGAARSALITPHQKVIHQKVYMVSGGALAPAPRAARQRDAPAHRHHAALAAASCAPPDAAPSRSHGVPMETPTLGVHVHSLEQGLGTFRCPEPFFAPHTRSGRVAGREPLCAVY